MMKFDTGPLDSLDLDDEQANLSAMVEGVPFRSEPGVSLGEVDPDLITPQEGLIKEGEPGVTGALYNLLESTDLIPLQMHGDESWYQRCQPLIHSIIDAEQELSDGSVMMAFIRLQHWERVRSDLFAEMIAAHNAHLPHPDAEGLVIGNDKGVVRFMTRNWMASTAIGTAQYAQEYPGVETPGGYYDLCDHTTKHTNTQPAHTADNELIRTTGVHAAQIPGEELEVITRSFLRVKLITPASPRFIEEE